MNKRQVIILWVVAAALGVAVAAVKQGQNKATRSATSRIHGQTLFESFPGNDVAVIEVDGAGNRVTLTKKDNKWVVSERDNYPANPTFVNDFIRTLGDLKVTQGLEAGPSFAPRFGMDESAASPEEHGIIATFKDASGKQIAKVGLGKNIESGSSNPSMGMMGAGAVGRYVRNYADESGFYAVSEMFPSVSAEPKRWLADGFISPEKIKSITVNKPGTNEADWKVTRDTEDAEFKLEGAAPGEVLDSTEATSLKSLFSYARFDDVVPTATVADRASPDGKRVATIETFEGFSYTVSLTPAKTATAAPAPVAPGEEPPAADNFLVTVDVAATIPAERKKEENEKPEDAKAKDSAFTERHKALTEKLAKEKALAGTTFEVAKSTVDPLLKNRSEILAKATPPAEGAPNGGSVQQLPGGMLARPPVTATTPPIEAVTPPISIPAIEEIPAEDDAAEAPMEDSPEEN